MTESKKVRRILLAVVVAIVLGAIGFLVANRVITANADAALASAVAEFEAADDALDALAENDGFAEYEAAVSAALAYSADATYEVTWLTGEVDASLLAAWQEKVTALDAVIEISTGEDVETQQLLPAEHTTEAFEAASAKASTAIEAATGQISVTEAATAAIEAAIVEADRALLAIAESAVASASALASAHPEVSEFGARMLDEKAAAVQQYLDGRAVTGSDSELVAILAQELLGTYYLTTPLASYAIVTSSYY